MENRQKIVFSTQNYDYLLKEVAGVSMDRQLESADENTNIILPEFVDGIISHNRFPDGETYQRIETRVDGADVFLIGGTPTDMDWLEIYDISCALVKYGAHTLTVIIPYMGYSTMERAEKPGEIVKAKTRTRILSMIPKSNRNRFIMMDLHVNTLPHYFEGNIITEEMSLESVIFDEIKEMGGDDFVLASADLGRSKQIRKMANKLGVSAAFIDKERKSGSETEVKLVIGADVKGKNVVMYDDMIRTGGTLIEAAKAYKEFGANKVYAKASHGVLPGNSAQKMQDAGVFEWFATTDSHPKAPISAASEGVELMKIVPISELIYKKIMSL